LIDINGVTKEGLWVAAVSNADRESIAIAANAFSTALNELLEEKAGCGY
jgi:hypothetical protein